MSDRRYDAADKARMAALVESNAELQVLAEHAEMELQVMRTRFAALEAEHERREQHWRTERGRWVQDSNKLDGIIRDNGTRIAALVDGYKELAKLIEESRGQTVLRPLMRERAWLIKALERLVGTDLEWDDAGVARVEVYGHRVAITWADYDVADTSTLAAEVEDMALDTGRCPKGHLVNFRPRQGRRNLGSILPMVQCPVCGERAKNPIPMPEHIGRSPNLGLGNQV